MWVSPQAWTSGFRTTTWPLLKQKVHTQWSRISQILTSMWASLTLSWLQWIKMQAVIITLWPVLGLWMNPSGPELLVLQFCNIQIQRAKHLVLFLIPQMMSMTKLSQWTRHAQSGVYKIINPSWLLTVQMIAGLIFSHVILISILTCNDHRNIWPIMCCYFTSLFYIHRYLTSLFSAQ